MTVTFLAFLPIVAFASLAASQIVEGARLPDLRGEFLTGREAILPPAAEGKVALLLLGFTYDSRFQVEAWAKKFREQFHSAADVTFYEIPMIGGISRLAKWFIDGGMRRGTPREDYEHVITVYRDTGEWKDRLRVTDPKAAYLILLDRAGKVAWRQSGAVDDAKFEALRAKVSELSKIQ
jgi:hypothetical protein